MTFTDTVLAGYLSWQYMRMPNDASLTSTRRKKETSHTSWSKNSHPSEQHLSFINVHKVTNTPPPSVHQTTIVNNAPKTMAKTATTRRTKTGK